MSIVSTLVFLSQSIRRLSVKAKNAMITRIKDRIAVLEDQQVELEAHRSSQMIDLHNKFYADEAEMVRKFELEMQKLKDRFNENKRTIALVHQAASDELKRERVMLACELDNLTK